MTYPPTLRNSQINKVAVTDHAAHDWYRFVLSFPPHLVREYVKRFELTESDCVLDPFCGTGTTNVECKKLGIPSLGVILKNSISPLPLHKTLILLDVINESRNDQFYEHELLGLAKALVFSISNLQFGHEVGIGNIRQDARVVASWMECMRTMSRDLEQLQTLKDTPVAVYRGDARHLHGLLEPNSVSAVITSPPSPNEKDYTRTTRLETVILGFVRNREELKELKRHLLRSNTRNVYKTDDDDQWIASHEEVQRIAQAIEERRIQLRKTSGFERLYHRVTKLYFGGMARHFAQLRHALKPGSYLAYVVGDQASYLRVMIRTGQLLADIAKSLEYEVVGVDLFRTRLATATREQPREEVIVLRWPGPARMISEPRPSYGKEGKAMTKELSSRKYPVESSSW